MPVFKSVRNLLIKKRLSQINHFVSFPMEVQMDLFHELINTASDTAWGKKYEYSTIESYEIFKDRVPVSTYDEIEPWISKIKNGEQNVLWPEPIKWFAKSSGTTESRSKFIPVSKSTLKNNHFRGGKDVLIFYLQNFPDTNIFNGKGLLMGGSRQLEKSHEHSYFVGDLSAILIDNMPYWAQLLRTPPKSVALMSEWEAKLDQIANISVKQNVTSISGVPSWTLVLFNKILEKTGKNNISEVWPDLEVFIHGGVSFEPYRRQYQHLISKPGMRYMETYNASEGFFGIQDDLNINDLMLMLDYGVFYEFVPMDEIGKKFPRSLTLAEAELKINYALIISTNSGLWRYMIGDTVQITSNNPYRIQITGRTKNFINIVGEELMIDNAEKAFAIACEKTNASIIEYTGGPIYEEDKICHEWLIEFSSKPDDFERFAKEFDEALKALNSDYEAKRYHNLVLKKPVLYSLDKGSFYHWLKKRNKLGGQHKVPRLLNHRKILDDILLHSKLAKENFKN